VWGVGGTVGAGVGGEGEDGGRPVRGPLLREISALAIKEL